MHEVAFHVSTLVGEILTDVSQVAQQPWFSVPRVSDDQLPVHTAAGRCVSDSVTQHKCNFKKNKLFNYSSTSALVLLRQVSSSAGFLLHCGSTTVTEAAVL